MKKSLIKHAFLWSCCVALAACGGGGGSGNKPASSSSSSSSTSSSEASSASSATSAISFTNVSVHDPSVIKVDGTYYVFGSHLAAAKTTDLMNWTLVASDVNNANPLFGNKVTTELADTFTWSQVTDLWAPDVVRLGDGKYYFYYNSCKGDSPRSALGVAVSDNIEGPYTNKQIMLRSGMWGQISEDGTTIYDANTQPNVVDPNTFFDKNGNLWMIYGSYSGGIFILSMDETTGLQNPGQGYGKHLLGGYHARIEGAYVLYNPTTDYYYMFTSFGGLSADGGYNIRVSRSVNPDGPYYDAQGTDMSTVVGNPDVIFDDTKIAPYGQKLMGNYQYNLATGETGTKIGYVSPGHNSAYYEAESNQYFLFFHTRFPNTGEYHEVRVHELFFNQDGWPVAAPYRYVPLSKSATPLAAAIEEGEVAGSYKLVNHGKDITATIKTSVNVSLASNGSLSGAYTGSWTFDGDNYITLEIDGEGTFKGVLSRQWNPNASSFVVTFSVQSAGGVSLWGSRSGD